MNTPIAHSILGHCRITNGKLWLNETLMPIEDHRFPEFMKTIYHFVSLDYPKFFKMDELCKLSFLGAELLLKDIPKGVIEGENTAIILSNNSSSFETDKKHQQSIQEEQNYFPSPAVFVYTLPNIAIGEIAIRHKIKGENTFFIFQKYDVDFMVAYVNALLTQNKATYCLTGWVEFNNKHYDCFLYLVGKYPTTTTHKHNSLFINKLYN